MKESNSWKAKVSSHVGEATTLQCYCPSQRVPEVSPITFLTASYSTLPPCLPPPPSLSPSLPPSLSESLPASLLSTPFWVVEVHCRGRLMNLTLYNVGYVFQTLRTGHSP